MYIMRIIANLAFNMLTFLKNIHILACVSQCVFYIDLLRNGLCFEKHLNSYV